MVSRVLRPFSFSHALPPSKLLIFKLAMIFPFAAEHKLSPLLPFPYSFSAVFHSVRTQSRVYNWKIRTPFLYNHIYNCRHCQYCIHRQRERRKSLTAITVVADIVRCSCNRFLQLLSPSVCSQRKAEETFTGRYKAAI